MFNLINAELYKLRKSKSFFVSFVVIFVCVFLLFGCMIMVDKTQKGEIKAGTLKFEAENVPEGQSVLELISVMEFEQAMIVSVIGVIVLVFVNLFVIRDFGNGAIKNVVGKGFSRIQIIISKYIVTSFAVISLIGFCTITVVLFGAVVLKNNNFNSEFWSNLLIYIVVQGLLHIAYAGILIVISEMTRNLGISIAISIGIYMFSGALMTGLDMLLQKYNILASDYWMIKLIEKCPITGFENDFVVNTIMVAIVWIIITFAVGSLHFKKADIK